VPVLTPNLACDAAARQGSYIERSLSDPLHVDRRHPTFILMQVVLILDEEKQLSEELGRS